MRQESKISQKCVSLIFGFVYKSTVWGMFKGGDSSVTGLMTELRILFLEDVPADAERVGEALRKAGVSVHLRRVDTREDFVRVIRSELPEVILSDHGLPDFDGFSALALAREICPEVPFIFVTNALTREMEIEKLAPGVMDFISKTHLEHLGPAIRRALEETREWRKTTLKEEERARIAAKLRLLLNEYELIPVCSNCKRIRDNQNNWLSADIFFRIHLEMKFTHGLCPDCVPRFFPPEDDPN
jgi:CheY-like chemotaxis protein